MPISRIAILGSVVLGIVACVVPPPVIAQEHAPPPREKLKLGEWRLGERKQKLLTDGGGTEKTEAAVAAGLKWLVSQQKADGSWVFTNTNYKHRPIAATGLALLCFLGAGHVPGDADDYSKVVKRGLAALLKLRDEKTGVISTLMYEQAIGTLALVEAYGMTGEVNLKEICQSEINVMVMAQTRDGGWRYELRPGIASGDVSVTGWVVQALTAAKRYTDLEVPNEVPEKASAFLEACAKGATKVQFAYQPSATLSPVKATTAIGLCSKIALDNWTAENARLGVGVVELLQRTPDYESSKINDPYFYYYATRAIYCHGGDAWAKKWNPKLQEYVLKEQDSDGTWPHRSSLPTINATGTLGSTCFHLLLLETYYRYPPTPK